MYPFKFQRPRSVAQAVQALREQPQARPLAGGQSLTAAMKLRLSAPPLLVDLAGIDGLAGITCDAESVTVGAMTRHADVAASAELAHHLPALAELAGGIADRMVRHMGTLGGSLANNDPSADYPAAVLGLQGRILTDRREIAAEDFFLGLFQTALQDDELITAVRFARPQRAAYAKFRHPASRYAVVGVLVAQFDAEVRVAVTGAGPCVFRVPAMEEALQRDFSVRAIEDITVSDDGLNTDIHADAAYRAHLVTQMAVQAASRALGRSAA